MKTVMKVVLAVVIYYVMHMTLVILFPSHSEEAERWETNKRLLSEDQQALEHFKKESQ